VSAKNGLLPPEWLLDPSGRPILLGTTIRNPGLAAIMRRIAEHGADAFYVGASSDIVQALHASDPAGVTTASDLLNYHVVERVPVCLATEGSRICTVPPPSFGGVSVLERLGLLGELTRRPGGLSDAVSVHRFIEAGRIAEADRLDFIGDPDVISGSADALLTASYLKLRASEIRDDASLPDPIKPGVQSPKGSDCSASAHAISPSTSQFAIVDRSGNALAVTTTNNVDFGAWITVDGFFLNDAMTNFAHPTAGSCAANFPAGNKRPVTAMAPVVALAHDNDIWFVGGSAGAGEIVDYITQAIIELSADVAPAAALDDGHVSTAKAPYAETPGLVELELGRAIAQLAPQLRSLGHKSIKITRLVSGAAFLVKRHGHWEGAADPRRDGTFATATGSTN